MTPQKIIIIHFRDPHLYPPLLNFISLLEKSGRSYKLITAKYQSSKFALARMWGKLFFVIQGNFHSTNKKNPILCFESISSIGLFISNFLNPKLKIFYHFHEYFSVIEYKNESRLERIGWKLEKNILERAVWISHTNKERINLWSKENPTINISKLHILPNYPPISWIEFLGPKRTRDGCIKLVHIGALSTEGMYLESVLEHFGNNSSYSIDFYSHKFTHEIKELISNYDNCSVNGSIAYQEIPKLKGTYDVGLVLYNGSSLNFTYNAPNKIFEYLALDLDVWCSDKLITAKEYERLNCYPKMVIVDFENLENFDVDKAINKNDLNYVQSPYVCEPVYEKFLNAINESSNS